MSAGYVSIMCLAIVAAAYAASTEQNCLSACQTRDVLACTIYNLTCNAQSDPSKQMALEKMLGKCMWEAHNASSQRKGWSDQGGSQAVRVSDEPPRGSEQLHNRRVERS